MLSLLKVIGKWGANVAIIVSIPIAHGEKKMNDHLYSVAVEREALHKNISVITDSVKDIRETQLEDRKLLHKILQIELDRLSKEKSH